MSPTPVVSMMILFVLLCIYFFISGDLRSREPLLYMYYWGQQAINVLMLLTIEEISKNYITSIKKKHGHERLQKLLHTVKTNKVQTLEKIQRYILLVPFHKADQFSVSMTVQAHTTTLLRCQPERTDLATPSASAYVHYNLQNG